MFYGVPCIILYYIYLHKSQKRRNWISFLRLFVLSRWSSRENEQTTKRQNKISFLRLFVLLRCTSRQNEEMEFHFFVCSFCCLPKARQNDKMTKIPQNIKVWSVVVTCLFCRLFDFHKAPNDRTTTRQNEVLHFVALFMSPKPRNEISIWRLFVLSPSIRRQNKQTKWPYPASIQMRCVTNLKCAQHCQFLTNAVEISYVVILMLYIRPCKLTYLNSIYAFIYQYGKQTWMAATLTEV